MAPKVLVSDKLSETAVQIFRDRGVEVDYLPSPELSALRAGGFGWVIIRDLTRSLFHYREMNRNVLCFNIPRSDGGDMPVPDGGADSAAVGAA